MTMARAKGDMRLAERILRRTGYGIVGTAPWPGGRTVVQLITTLRMRDYAKRLATPRMMRNAPDIAINDAAKNALENLNGVFGNTSGLRMLEPKIRSTRVLDVVGNEAIVLHYVLFRLRHGYEMVEPHSRRQLEAIKRAGFGRIIEMWDTAKRPRNGWSPKLRTFWVSLNVSRRRLERAGPEPDARKILEGKIRYQRRRNPELFGRLHLESWEYRGFSRRPEGIEIFGKINVRDIPDLKPR
jgi:hypothetical protein